MQQKKDWIGLDRNQSLCLSFNKVSWIIDTGSQPIIDHMSYTKTLPKSLRNLRCNSGIWDINITSTKEATRPRLWLYSSPYFQDILIKHMCQCQDLCLLWTEILKWVLEHWMVNTLTRHVKVNMKLKINAYSKFLVLLWHPRII